MIGYCGSHYQKKLMIKRLKYASLRNVKGCYSMYPALGESAVVD